MKFRIFYLMPLLFTFISSSLCGCVGLTVPDVQEPYQTPLDLQAKENMVLNQIKCELRQGVHETIDKLSADGDGLGYNADWLKTWIAKVSLKTTVDEKAALNPGLSISKSFTNGVTPFLFGGNIVSPRNFSLGLGGQASSDATRTETVGVTYDFPSLLKTDLPCKIPKGILIESDLKIGEFILRKASLARIPGNISAKKLKSPLDVFNYEASFVFTYGGSVTPVWKFIRISADTNSTLFNASRASTNDVTITMGPPAVPNTAIASDDVNQQHLASLIGQAVARSIQSQQQ